MCGELHSPSALTRKEFFLLPYTLRGFPFYKHFLFHLLHDVYSETVLTFILWLPVRISAGTPAAVKVFPLLSSGAGGK